MIQSAQPILSYLGKFPYQKSQTENTQDTRFESTEKSVMILVTD